MFSGKIRVKGRAEFIQSVLKTQRVDRHISRIQANRVRSSPSRHLSAIERQSITWCPSRTVFVSCNARVTLCTARQRQLQPTSFLFQRLLII
jgi:hypothetical protein